MPSRYEEIDPSKARLESIEGRRSLVRVEDYPKPAALAGEQAEALLDGFPPILAGAELRALLSSLARAREQGTPRIWTMGAHPIKVGVSRHLIALLEAGFITHLAVNGAEIVHDVEIACFGHTSEDVSGTIHEGKFAVTKETGEFINSAAARAWKEKLGFGEAVGEDLIRRNPPHLDASIAAACHRLEVPFTVHVAIGTDVPHIQPDFDGAATGASTARDFRIFAASVSKLHGGVIVNLGSAVVMPVVIEKAIALVQNLGFDISGFDGFNLDFIRHYRPNLNPVQRAKEVGGHGGHIIGHHEITIPLICALLLSKDK